MRQGGLGGSCVDILHDAHTVIAATAPVKAPVMNMANTLLPQPAVTAPVEAIVNAAPAAAAASVNTKATGHVAGAAVTCTTPQTCLVCGAVIQEVLGHHFWQETTKPGCASMGYTNYTCINCNQSYKSDYVSALVHNYSEQTTAPSCNSQGYTTYTCRKCGDSYVGNYRETTDHVWDNGTEKVNATCNGAGMIEYHCANAKCDAVRLETASAAGHTAGEAATCTEPQLCSKCGAVLQTLKVIGWSSR